MPVDTENELQDKESNWYRTIDMLMSLNTWPILYFFFIWTALYIYIYIEREREREKERERNSRFEKSD